jgi:hypothetical protein
MVSDVYFPRVNGVSTSIQTLRQALVAAGHTSVLVAPDYPAAAAESGIVRVPGWQIPRDPEDRLMHPRALDAALDQLDSANFDLVHIHTPFLAHRGGVNWARRHGLPCVETYHTLFEEYFHHYLPFLPKAWLAAAARMISRKECDGVSAVIAPSSAMRNALQAYGVSSPIHIIPTGSLADFAHCDGPAFRARHGIAPERLVILRGTVAFEKNLISLRRPSRCGASATLLVAGEGPARPLSAQWRTQAHRQRASSAISNAGPSCRPATRPTLRVRPKTETQGLVLLEAMALGVPVVALAEADEGRSGRRRLPHRAGRRVRIAATLLPLLADRAAARTLGAAGSRTRPAGANENAGEIPSLSQPVSNAAARGHAVSVCITCFSGARMVQTSSVTPTSSPPTPPRSG